MKALEPEVASHEAETGGRLYEQEGRDNAAPSHRNVSGATDNL